MNHKNKLAWNTLQHNGVYLTPKYKPKGIKIKIKGRVKKLNAIQEEMIYCWSKLDKQYSNDKTFQKNFMIDFAKTFKIKFSYSDLNYTNATLLKYKIKIKPKKYCKAKLDSKPVKIIGAVEPPGIFIGKGNSPMRGRWKKRIQAYDIMLNLDKNAKIPHGKWKKILHQKESIWIAKWHDPLAKKIKYVYLDNTAHLCQIRDKTKYDTAMDLGNNISMIRSRMIQDMKKPRTRIVATVSYMIYKTAMRVGDEKNKDEADTIGATTLRAEHVKISKNAIKFDFLGKGSIRWKKTIHIGKNDAQFKTNLAKISKNAKKGMQLFPDMTSKQVNQYYSSIQENLTAKVFRTYLATRTVIRYLHKYDNIKNKSNITKLYHARCAIIAAAKLCNHKTIHKTSLAKKRDSLYRIKSSRPKTRNEKKIRKNKIQKLEQQMNLAQKMRKYNLAISLGNYIDPRVFKSWMQHIDYKIDLLYSKSMRNKFLWAKATRWNKILQD